MTCTEFERLLDQKQPDAQTEGALQRHAEQCAHCRMLLELRQLDAEEQVPEEVTARWQAALRTEQAKARMEKRRGTPLLRLVGPLAAVAAVLVAAVALRQPISNLAHPLSTASPSAKAAVQENAVRTTPVPVASELTGAGSAPRQAVVQSTAAPTQLPLMEMATYSVPADEPADSKPFAAMEAPEEADELIFDMDSPVEEPAMEEAADEAVYEAEIADGDSLIPLGDAVYVESVRWRAAQPTEALKTLLSAMGIGQDGPSPEQEEDGSVRLRLEVSRAEWPAFLSALAEAGCDEPPEEPGWTEDPVPLDVIIEKMEEP